MRTLIASLALSLLATTASAKPRHVSPAKAAATAWMTTCVHEHTGPVGGVTLPEAQRLCKAMAKKNKAAQRAAKAIEACEELVVEECLGDDGHDDSCEDDALRERGAFDVCTGHGPAAAKGGKTMLWDLWRAGCDALNVNGGSGFAVETGGGVHFYTADWKAKAGLDKRYPTDKAIHGVLRALAIDTRTQG